MNYANAVSCNNATNQITIAGFTVSDGTFPNGGISTFGTSEPFNGGGTYDGFVSEFKKDTFLLINQPFVDTILCAGGTLSVPFSVFSPGVAYLPGNTYAVQLSDITGSFASPDTIGMGIASPVICTVPNTPGSGYRITHCNQQPFLYFTG